MNVLTVLVAAALLLQGSPSFLDERIGDRDPKAPPGLADLTLGQMMQFASLPKPRIDEARCSGFLFSGAYKGPAAQPRKEAVRAAVTAAIANDLHPQSAHIAQGVDASGNKDEGAGDQGIMFGFACDETPDLMPATLDYSHKILEAMAADRHSGTAPFLEPDAKSQVTLRFENGRPVEATAIVVSTQHAIGYDEGDKEAALKDYVKGVIAKVLPGDLLTDNTVYHINPTGSFVIGGPDGDSGLTGRKIIVDTYGGAAPHGGGAFSGKDPTKVDRSAAYAARWLAKNIVAAGLARRCTIQLAYAIGVPEPLSLYVDTHGTGSVSEEAIEAAIGKIERLGRLTPRGIRTALGLNKPIYAKTAAYGHFGRKADGDLFPWESTDLVDDLKAALAG